MKLFMKWLVCLAVLLLTAQIFPGTFVIRGGPVSYLAAATILWALNLFIRPLLQVLALPVSFLTFGLFSFFVNGAVVALADAVLPALTIGSFWICLLISLLISAGNTLILKKK